MVLRKNDRMTIWRRIGAGVVEQYVVRAVVVASR